MTHTDKDGLYLYEGSPLERHALNLMLEKLIQGKDANISDILKSMSGLRSETSGNQKVKLPTSKSLLRKWHKLGIITVVHGKVRLGNFSLYSDILDEQNLTLLRARFGSTQNTVSVLMK